MSRCWIACSLVAALVSVVFPQGGVDLLPDYLSKTGTENHPKETTTRSPVCTASLDVQTHGNPNCPQDQQYFDIDRCKFVCLSTQTAVPPLPTPQKSDLT